MKGQLTRSVMRIGAWALVIVLVAAISPVGAHVSNRVGHLWGAHLKPRHMVWQAHHDGGIILSGPEDVFEDVLVLDLPLAKRSYLLEAKVVVSAYDGQPGTVICAINTDERGLLDQSVTSVNRDLSDQTISLQAVYRFNDASGFVNQAMVACARRGSGQPTVHEIKLTASSVGAVFDPAGI